MPTDAQAVLDFWFGAPSEPGHGQTRPEWFRKDAAFDALTVHRFGALIERAWSVASTTGPRRCRHWRA